MKGRKRCSQKATFYISKVSHVCYLFFHIWNEWKCQSHPTREKCQTWRKMHLLYFTDKTGLKGTQREHDVKIHYAHSLLRWYPLSGQRVVLENNTRPRRQQCLMTPHPLIVSKRTITLAYRKWKIINNDSCFETPVNSKISGSLCNRRGPAFSF